MDKNITLIAVSRFAKVARQYLGTINLVKMMEDKQYATDVVLKAYQTDKVFLVELAEDLTFLLALDTQLVLSIRRYVAFLRLLQRQDQVEQYWPHLLNLVYFLVDCLPTNEAYRAQVNTFMNHQNKIDQVVCLEMVREFYPFWYQSYNVIDEDQNVQDLKLPLPNKGADQNPLVAIWNELQEQPLVMSEQVLLDQYLTGLRQVKYLGETIEIRTKIAKFLLIQLREFNGKTGVNYREAVDLVYSVVQAEDLKIYMFEICREFYPFWMHDQEAITKLEAVAKFKKEIKV
jgi:ribosomal protein L31